MLKWKILAVTGLVFGLAGVTWGYAQQSIILRKFCT